MNISIRSLMIFFVSTFFIFLVNQTFALHSSVLATPKNELKVTQGQAQESPNATDPANQNAGENRTDADINRFTNTIGLIKDFYVQKVGDRNLLDDAIRGMVGGLDPHSEYLDKEAYKSLLMATSGEFGGIGIEVTPEYGILKVVTPIDDTPASKAGIK